MPFDEPEPKAPREQLALPEHEPWQQLAMEPVEDYRKFLHYLYLGPRRTVLAAYNNASAPEGAVGLRKAPAHWRTAASDWRWLLRAGLWDCQQLQDLGTSFAPLYAEGMRKLLLLWLRSIGRVKVTKAEELIALTDAISKYMTPAVLGAMTAAQPEEAAEQETRRAA